jgi:hypothetical protein
MNRLAGRLAVITGGLVLFAAPAYGLLVASSSPANEVRLTPVAAAVRPEPTTTAPSTTAKPAVAPERPNAEPTPEPRPDVQVLELKCAPQRTDAGPGAACGWTRSGSRSFAGYELWRAGPGDEPRTVVFRTPDRDVTRFLDAPLRLGSYRYKVLAKDAEGRVVGQSRVAEVQLGDRPVDVEPLRLECRGGMTDERAVIGCRWSASQSERFAGYRLMRKGPDGMREIVFRTDDRGATQFAEHDVRPGVTYAYKVVAVGTDEKVVGESRVAEASVGPVAAPASTDGSGDATER